MADIVEKLDLSVSLTTSSFVEAERLTSASTSATAGRQGTRCRDGVARMT
jgi:hypothetical protein